MRTSHLIVAGLVLLASGCGKSPPQNAGSPAVAPAPSGQIPGPPGSIPGPPGVPGSAPAVTPLPASNVISDTLLAERFQQSRNNLKQIGLALHNYHDQNQKFPPAFVADAAGKPLYSWRVLLLPYLNQQGLFERFDKSQAWDAPGNLEISNTALEVFKSPADAAVAANGVSYVAIVGAKHVFQGTTTIGFRDVSDGTSNTVALVEVRGVAGSWAAPVDLQASALKWSVGNGAGELHSPYPKGLHVLMLDGSTKLVRPETVSQAFPTALGINDGMLVELD